MDINIDIKGSISNATSAYTCALLNGLNKGDGAMLVINSIGGSIIETFSIVSSIMQAQERGIVVKTLCTGVADSCASWILAMGNKGDRYVMTMASALIHSVQVPQPDEEDPTKEKLVSIYDIERNEKNEQLFIISEQMERLITKQTGMELERLKELFSANGGFGTTLKSEELISNGYADKEFKSSQLKNQSSFLQTLKNVKDRMEVYNAMLAFNCSDIDNKNLITKKTNKMDALQLQNIARKLGMDSLSTEEQVLERVTTLNDRISTLNEQLKNEKSFTEKLESERVEFIVNQAVAQRKIANTDIEKAKLKNEATLYKSVDIFAKKVLEMPTLETLKNESINKLGNKSYGANTLGNKNESKLMETTNIDWEDKEKKEADNESEEVEETSNKSKFMNALSNILKGEGLSEETANAILKNVESIPEEEKEAKNEGDEDDKMSEKEAVNLFKNMNEEEKEQLKAKNKKMYNRLNKSCNETEEKKEDVANIAKNISAIGL